MKERKLYGDEILAELFL